MKLVALMRGRLGLRTVSGSRRAVAIVVLALAGTIAFAAQAEAATFTVGSTADTGGCSKPPTGTTCTLRQLVNSVPAGSVIDVPAGTYTLTAGELLVNQNLTIAGDGARTTTVEQNPPAGTPTARVFDVQRDANGAVPTVTISGLEILFGKTTSTSPNANAGGNILNEGTLTLREDHIVLGETTGGSGAGVANINGTLTITHSLLEDNLSFASNGSGGISGAIDNVASGVTTSTVTLDNTTIVNNTAQGGAGAIGSRCIRCTSSAVTIVNSTIFNNDGGTATTNAGGLIAGTGSSISVENSIIASNTVGSGATASNCAGSITSLGRNIETSTDCGFKSTGDLQKTDPQFLFSGVTDLGGNTDTLPLSASSPAVDAIPTSASNCTKTTDQRDINRPQGSSCDIGAYELIEPVEGAPFSEVVGSIDNTSATIDWGDGTAQSNGSVDPTTREVTGTHTYAEAGIYHGTLHWLNSDGNPSTRAFDVKVTDAALSATATPVSATQGTSFSGTVATFTDANPLSKASDFTATIAWGDGTAATAGSVATNAGGGFKVTGTHTYSKTGSFTTTITINDVGGSTASATGTATVSPPRPVVTSVSPSAGPTAGGTSVTITGTNLGSATAVKFGANAATVTTNTATQIVATNPAGSAGTVDVTVTNAGGTSATSANDQFTYAAVPTVTSVSPSAGPTGGGTSVTITGTAFTNASAVKFGTTSATSLTVNSATSITATAPAGSAGTVDITVATPGGTSATSINDNYRYAAVPTITAVSPSAAPTAGGNSVTITGTNFTGATAVKFGTTNATFTIVSATQITATAPAESAGTVDITITTPGGTSATSASDQYTYAGTPTVSGLAPNAGPLGGGTTVTITGANLSLASAVKFGATSAIGVTVVSATKITATAPAAALAGAVDVTVTTPGGTSATTAADQYTYTNGPSVASISPTSGPTAGGTSVTITGANLASATAVKFGSNTATINSNTATQIVAVAPAGSAGAVDVTVTTVGGTSPGSVADRYTYAGPPTVTGVSPTSGPTLGGTVVTITGTNLDNPSAVNFGGSNAAVVTPISATQIIAVAPAGSAGAQDVRVTTPGGTSATSSADRFTFVPPPTVTGVSPSSGPAAGGTSVTITGKDFTGASAVHFGASQAPAFSVVNATQITATSPSGAGIADVTVTTASGTSPTAAADQFTYDAAKIPPSPSSPVVLTGAPSVHSSSAAALEGSVNPQGLATTAHYEYGLDSQFRASGPVYDQSTPSQSVGSDFSSHTVVASLSGLVPNALYHVRLVATNSAGTTFGPDATFTTKADPPPPPPKLGGSFNAEPLKGLVFVEINGKFIPITEVRQIPNGAIINALHGTVELITSAGGSTSATASRAAKSKKPTTNVTTQKGTFGGAVFKVTQGHSGLVTLSLVEGASFAGAPTYASCQTHSGKATVAALSKKTLQLLKGSDNHGKFRTKGRYAAATVRGTVWSTADRCDGTLTHVTRGTVVVVDLVRHKTITVHAGHSYLALARPPKHK